MVGEPGGAKTTYFLVIKNALGPDYFDVIDESAIDASVKAASSGLSPERASWAAPRRIVMKDEINVRALNEKTLKNLSGDGIS